MCVILYKSKCKKICSSEDLYNYNNYNNNVPSPPGISNLIDCNTLSTHGLSFCKWSFSNS